jgi:hypothetical protein
VHSSDQPVEDCGGERTGECADDKPDKDRHGLLRSKSRDISIRHKAGLPLNRKKHNPALRRSNGYCARTNDGLAEGYRADCVRPVLKALLEDRSC